MNRVAPANTTGLDVPDTFEDLLSDIARLLPLGQLFLSHLRHVQSPLSFASASGPGCSPAHSCHRLSASISVLDSKSDSTALQYLRPRHRLPRRALTSELKGCGGCDKVESNDQQTRLLVFSITCGSNFAKRLSGDAFDCVPLRRHGNVIDVNREGEMFAVTRRQVTR